MEFFSPYLIFFLIAFIQEYVVKIFYFHCYEAIVSKGDADDIGRASVEAHFYHVSSAPTEFTNLQSPMFIKSLKLFSTLVSGEVGATQQMQVSLKDSFPSHRVLPDKSTLNKRPLNCLFVRFIVLICPKAYTVALWTIFLPMALMLLEEYKKFPQEYPIFLYPFFVTKIIKNSEHQKYPKFP